MKKLIEDVATKMCHEDAEAASHAPVLASEPLASVARAAMQGNYPSKEGVAFPRHSRGPSLFQDSAGEDFYNAV